MQDVVPLLAVFNTFDYAVLAFNLLLFLFATTVVQLIRPSSDEAVVASRVYTIRAANVILFVLYFSAILFLDFAKQLSQTGLTLLVAVMTHYAIATLILKRYGRVRDIDGTAYRSETYQSEMFSLITLILTAVTVVLVVINIWGMTSWLKATSVLGGLLIVLFSTKDHWAPDNIHGLILLYNGDIEPGTLIEVNELDLLGIVIQTTLTQTRLRDLRARHIIIIPNARLRASKIEILSKSAGKGLMRSADFQIGYGVDSERVEDLFEQIWTAACESDKSINTDRPAVARLAATGDHGVSWRLVYWLSNSYGLIDAAFAINRAAYDVAQREQIELNTPLTHTIEVIGDADRMTVEGSA
jgi:small-conductance mechanosensitive channel